MSQLEIRSVPGDLAVVAGNKVVGYASVYESRSEDLGGFHEVVKPSAFSKTLSEGRDVRALAFHNPERLLGRTKSGTLKLGSDSRGLQFELSLPRTRDGDDIREQLSRGDITGASFSFSVKAEKWLQGGTLRELHDVALHEISLVATPAYQETSVALRSLDQWKGEQRQHDEQALAEQYANEMRRRRQRLLEIEL
jgi:HK97 family phage prohead protease